MISWIVVAGDHLGLGQDNADVSLSQYCPSPGHLASPTPARPAQTGPPRPVVPRHENSEDVAPVELEETIKQFTRATLIGSL